MSNSAMRRDSARQAVIEIARGMLDGTVALVEGCRSLVQLPANANIPQTEAFNVFAGVESETDDYPVGSQRSGYAPELLAQLDIEVSSYLNTVRPAVIEACRQIIREIEILRLQS